VVKFILWCMLLVLCWPVALVALVLYPLVWLLLLPFRLGGDCRGRRARAGVGAGDAAGEGAAVLTVQAEFHGRRNGGLLNAREPWVRNSYRSIETAAPLSLLRMTQP